MRVDIVLGSASIVAADSGKVIHCGWMGGYGQVIVVDHGNGLSTLYAHMSAYAVVMVPQLPKDKLSAG